MELGFLALNWGGERVDANVVMNKDGPTIALYALIFIMG